MSQSVDERLKRSLREVAEAEEKLAELRREKENVLRMCVCVPCHIAMCIMYSVLSLTHMQLESALQRMPSHGGRVTRQSKQTKVSNTIAQYIVVLYVYSWRRRRD